MVVMMMMLLMVMVMVVMMTAEATTPPVEDYACYVDSKDDRVGHSMITNVKGMTHEVSYVNISDLK